MSAYVNGTSSHSVSHVGELMTEYLNIIILQIFLKQSCESQVAFSFHT